MIRRIFLLLLALLLAAGAPLHAAETAHPEPAFVTRMKGFEAEEEAQGIHGIGARLAFRARQEPFLAVATALFVLAILHTFAAVPITRLAHRAEQAHQRRLLKRNSEEKDVSLKATLLHFASEVEAVFGIWALVLLAAMLAFYDLRTVEAYVSSINFTEPLFVVVIMALASTRPVLRFAESCLGMLARLGKGTPGAWWLAILCAGPLLGSFITEPGAMTICAMLLARKFYALKPRPLFAYGTLGLLFVNISVGGLLTHFAAPPVLMVAQKWGLTTPEMMLHYGYKAAIAVIAATGAYYLYFRKDLAAMGGQSVEAAPAKSRPIPWYVTATHLAFMAWTVGFAHTPGLFLGGFLFFLAFSEGTAHHQRDLQLRGPILVGFFLASLVVHGGLQGWWLAPILSSLTRWPLFLGSAVLTSFNDNAAITFLASQVHGLAPALKYAVLAGAVAGGGLTVIANAPNPAGQALLGRFFSPGVSPGKLLAAALIPTVIAAACLMLFPDHGIEAMFAQPAGAPAEAPAENLSH